MAALRKLASACMPSEVGIEAATKAADAAVPMSQIVRPLGRPSDLIFDDPQTLEELRSELDF